MRLTLLKSLAICATALTLGLQSADATPLTPGGSIVMTGTTSASQPELIGSVVEDGILTTNTVGVPTLPVLFAYFNVQNRVTESSADGTMIFAPRITGAGNVTQGNLLVDRMILSGYGLSSIDAAYRTDGAGTRGPTAASRSADGDILDFTFGFPLVFSNLVGGVAEDSYFFSLKTNATEFENTGRLSIFARAEGDNFNTYRFDLGGIAVPVLPDTTPTIPLPAGLPLLIGGLAALTSLGARRRNRV